MTFDNYLAYVNELKNDNFTISKFSENNIRGSVTVNESKILFFSIPFDEGWSAKLNGTDAKLLVDEWRHMLAVMAILSLAIGNLTAIMQTNLKRMLAYSTISHMGFLLLGVLSGTIDGYGASMWRHSSTSISAPSPWASRRITMANAANFGAEPMNMVTAVGAPS